MEDYFRGVDAPHTDALDYEIQNKRIITGDLIITEFLQGFRNNKDILNAKNIMESLEYRDMVGKEIAYRSAENYRVLKSKGITVRKTIDVIIGTFCITNEFKLIHNDLDFDPMEIYLGLKVRK